MLCDLLVKFSQRPHCANNKTAPPERRNAATTVTDDNTPSATFVSVVCEDKDICGEPEAVPENPWIN